MFQIHQYKRITKKYKILLCKHLTFLSIQIANLHFFNKKNINMLIITDITYINQINWLK